MNTKDFQRMIKNMFGINTIMKRKLLNPNDLLKDTDITLSDIKILFMVYYNTTLSVSQISKETFISKPNCSKSINTLVKKGLVDRKHDEKDRRIIKVFLTETGKSFVKKKNSEIIAHLQNQLEKLNKQDIELLNNATNDFFEIISKFK